MKYIIVLLSFLFLFACSQEETSPRVNTSVNQSENTLTLTGTSTSSATILPPNEKTTQAEQEFANELNTLLNTVEETPNE